ncbi:MAG TPA: hypothetical protein VHY33_01875, partial [Thermoanaerobaculia bacterium]|nr:hypothetical protein [Thermoanaerobaculia bacterium]
DTAQKLAGRLDADTRTEAKAIQSLLARVAAMLEAKEVEKAVGIFEGARLRYVALIAGDLRERIQSQPAGIDVRDWNDIAAQTRAALDSIAKLSDPDAAQRELGLAIGNYARLMAAGLLKTAASKNYDPAPITAALAPIDQAISAGNYAGVWSALTSAAKALQTASGNRMGASLETATAAPATSFAIPEIIDLPSSWASLTRRGAATRRLASVAGFDIIVSFIVLIAATAIGIQTLWVDNPTWGGWPSYLGAFIWGFGLDQFTHAGVVGLRGK